MALAGPIQVFTLNRWYAHFDVEEVITDLEIVYKFNQLLPKNIAVIGLHEVKDDAHARFNALSRTYQYIISEKKNPFTTEGAHYLKNPMNIDAMNEASQSLFNYKNFKAFSKVHTDVKTYNCKMMITKWERHENTLVFTIKADRFLRNMVRAIVGTLIDVGSGKTQHKEFIDIIESQNRGNAGTSVPAKGLYLMNIAYPEDTFINGRN